MTFNQFAAATVLSVLVVSGSVVAQAVKKPVPKKAVSKATSTRPTTVAKPVSLASGRDSLSYSIGVNIAQSIKQQGIGDLNTAALAKAIDDVLTSKSTQLTLEQSQQVLSVFMQKQASIKMGESQKVSDANKKIGDAFLADNKGKTGVQTTTSGLQYLIEKEGTGPKPASTDKVKVHYTGRLINGKVFDSSVDRQPIEFPVTGVIPGWIEALQLMPVGSKWKLFIPSALAYGDRGAGADIAPGSTLIFDVELLDIVK
ncbi:MAG: FKBP-type peptidyl-prolyl cis-trans isomerase [Bacteroidetes bacterium]|nr:FKBP-type peptidyl-prolyl cis-trans isomerase [Fibrella sp.]